MGIQKAKEERKEEKKGRGKKDASPGFPLSRE